MGVLEVFAVLRLRIGRDLSFSDRSLLGMAGGTWPGRPKPGTEFVWGAGNAPCAGAVGADTFVDTDADTDADADAVKDADLDVDGDGAADPAFDSLSSGRALAALVNPFMCMGHIMSWGALGCAQFGYEHSILSRSGPGPGSWLGRRVAGRGLSDESFLPKDAISIGTRAL